MTGRHTFGGTKVERLRRAMKLIVDAKAECFGVVLARKAQSEEIL